MGRRCSAWHPDEGLAAERSNFRFARRMSAMPAGGPLDAVRMVPVRPIYLAFSRSRWRSSDSRQSSPADNTSAQPALHERVVIWVATDPMEGLMPSRLRCSVKRMTCTGSRQGLRLC